MEPHEIPGVVVVVLPHVVLHAPPPLAPPAPVTQAAPRIILVKKLTNCTERGALDENRESSLFQGPFHHILSIFKIPFFLIINQPLSKSPKLHEILTLITSLNPLLLPLFSKIPSVHKLAIV